MSQAEMNVHLTEPSVSQPEAAVVGSGSFTPGEWEAFVEVNEGGGWRLPVQSIRIECGDKLICTYTTEYAEYPDDATNAANAHLMAAAPNLLRALVRALDTMEMQEGRERGEFHIPQDVALGLWGDAKSEIRAAISKVREAA